MRIFKITAVHIGILVTLSQGTGQVEGNSDELLFKHAESRVATVTGCKWTELSCNNSMLSIIIRHTKLADETIGVLDLLTKKATIHNVGSRDKAKIERNLTKERERYLANATELVDWEELPSVDPFVSGLDGESIYIEIHWGKRHWRGVRSQFSQAFASLIAKDHPRSAAADPFASNNPIQRKLAQERCLSLFLCMCVEMMLNR